MLEKKLYKKIDWWIIVSYLGIVAFGIMNIYASIYNESTTFSLSSNNLSLYQLIWVGISIVVGTIILLFINPKFILGLSWWFYMFIIFLLVLVLFIGKEVNGAKAWIGVGPLRFQPSEFSKITTSMALASIIGKYNFRITNRGDILKLLLVLSLPASLIMLEPDPGTVLVYCGFAFMLYREGLSGWILSFAGWIVIIFIITLKFGVAASILSILFFYGAIKGIVCKKVVSHIAIYGTLTAALWALIYYLKIDPDYTILFIIPPIIISLWRNKKSSRPYHLKHLLMSIICSVIFIYSVQVIFDNVLKPHHRDRIENLLGITEDLQGAGYNVNQSKIAIGSGGLRGKGYLQGTQTKFKFVPEQSTDFIFCTIGEEWGFLGSVGIITLFFILIYRIIKNSEKSSDRTIRVYGYCVACCIFMHVFINIAMTIGLFPVVGIPLPFVSYGGTSFLAFTILLFIFLRLDLERWG